MRFVAVREFRINPGKVWNKLKRERDLVVTSHGKPIAILTKAQDTTLEQDLAALRSARALNALAFVQRKSVRSGLDKLSLGDINREIQAVRRKKRR